MPDMQNLMARAVYPAMTDWSGEISGAPAAPAQAAAHTSTTTTTTTSSSASAAPGSSTTTTTMPVYGQAAAPSAAPAYQSAAPGTSSAAPAYQSAAPGTSSAAPAYQTAAPAVSGMADRDRAAAPAPAFRSEFDGSVGTLDLQTHQPLEVIEAPASMNEAFLGSLKAMLLRNRGNFVTATFLIGTQGTTAWEGILHDIGNDYLIIFQPGRQRYIACDIYSLKYIEFYDTRQQQMCEQLMRENGWRNSY